MAQLNYIHENGEWPKYFTEVTMTALNKKPKATKCYNHDTISLIAHAAQVGVRIFRTEKKIEDTLGQDTFRFRRGIGTRNAMGALRIISEQTLDIGCEIRR